MPALHLAAALLSLTALAGSLGERGANGWGRCAAAVMAVAMVGSVIPVLQMLPDVVWCAALITLAIAAAFAARRAGHQGLDALRTPLSAVMMAVLVVAAGAAHSVTGSTGTASGGAHDHHDGSSLTAIVVLAAAAQVAICISDLQRSRATNPPPGPRRAIIVRAGSMGAASLAMAAAALLSA